jgi:ParB family chromosome partitioning protein
MTTLSIALDHLRADPCNARHIPAETDVAALAASIDHVGLLQPIVVRHDPTVSDDCWLVVAGSRRVAAYRALGRTHIAAVEYTALNGVASDELARAASAAENMVRAAMHPVDTWRAMKALIDGGYSLEGAADSLGVSHPTARRLDHLGRMAPDLIEAIATGPELPPNATLRTISLAPHAVQQKALATATRQGRVDWWRVAQGCETLRIRMSRAIFDTATADIAFDEDLFAQPDDDERFTTTDIKGFLAAQEAALQAKAAASRGRMTMLPWSRPVRLRDRLPKEWLPTYDLPKQRYRKDDPRHVFASVTGEGYEIGAIEYVVAEPRPARTTAAAAASDVSDDAVVRERPPVTKAVQATLSALKGSATRAAARRVAVEWAEADNWPDVVRLLLLAFTAKNVSVNTVGYGRQLHHLAGRLLEPEGDIKALTERQLGELVANVIDNVIRFDHPNTNFGTSGDAAEWIGHLVGAEHEMPRCDTEEVLRGFNGDKLVEIAEANGIDASGKVSELRKRLIGSLPDWRPVTFGAPAPDGESDEASDVSGEEEDA